MTTFHRALGLAGAIAITAACTSSAAPAPTADPAAKATDVAIDIQGFAFPANTTVAKGAKVTWTNKDAAKHTVTSGTRPNKDGTFDSTLDAAGTFSFTFTDAGTYPYYCSFHGGMAATITVK